jgi:hypothetical protein
MRRVAVDGYDMTIDGHIGLNLFRDGKRPAVQGGRFGPSEAMRNPAGVEQSVILDRLDGGVGAVERLVPHTYPLAIDGCTRFSRAWTPSGQILDILPLPPFGTVTPGRVRAMIPWRDQLWIAAGGVIYRLTYANLQFLMPEAMYAVDIDEEIQDLIEFNDFLLASTFKVDTFGNPTGAIGHLYGTENGTTWVHGGTTVPAFPGLPVAAPAYRQHLVKSYMTIDDVGAWRLTGTNTPWTFKFIAADTSTDLATILDDGAWAGGTYYQVGDLSARITNMAGSPLVMFFCKEDGVYHVGPDGRAARIADWSDCIHPTNGEVFYFAYGGLYASNIRWGLLRIDVANLQVQWQTNACAPGANLPRVVPGSGRTTAFTMDGEWMVASIFNGVDSYTYYGRPVEITERTAMINLQSPQALNWHGSEGTFYGRQVTAMEQATLGPNDRPLLWVAWETTLPPPPGVSGSPVGTPGVSCISLPKYGTPLEDWLMGGPHRFQTDSWLYYPRQDWGDERGSGPYTGWASVRKVFNRIDLTGEYLERYVTYIDAYMSNGEGRIEQGPYAGRQGHWLFWDRATDPENTLWTLVGRFDEGTRASYVPGKSIQSGIKASLMLHGVGEPDKPFAFYGAKLRGTPILEQSERRTYRVTFGRHSKANQGMDHTMRLAQLNELWALQWADPVTLLDHNRIPLVVDIDPSMSYEDVTEPNTMEPSIVVTFSCRIIRRPFIWGAGYRFGSDIAWS